MLIQFFPEQDNHISWCHFSQDISHPKRIIKHGPHSRDYLQPRVQPRVLSQPAHYWHLSSGLFTLKLSLFQCNSLSFRGLIIRALLGLVLHQRWLSESSACIHGTPDFHTTLCSFLLPLTPVCSATVGGAGMPLAAVSSWWSQNTVSIVTSLKASPHKNLISKMYAFKCFYAKCFL